MSLKAKEWIPIHGWEKLINGEIVGGGTNLQGIEIPFDVHQWKTLKPMIDEGYAIPDEWWVQS